MENKNEDSSEDCNRKFSKFEIIWSYSTISYEYAFKVLKQFYENVLTFWTILWKGFTDI